MKDYEEKILEIANELSAVGMGAARDLYESCTALIDAFNDGMCLSVVNTIPMVDESPKLTPKQLETKREFVNRTNQRWKMKQ